MLREALVRPSFVIVLDELGQHLYRRGLDPETGGVTLYFHLPDRAREVYAEATVAVR